MLYDYFKQLFAQVTNPAIDSIREEVIMSLECYIGPEQNLLDTTPRHAHRLRVPHPILTNGELRALKNMDYRGWHARTIDITWPLEEGEAGLEAALDRVCSEAEGAIDDGYQLVILSDRPLHCRGRDSQPRQPWQNVSGSRLEGFQNTHQRNDFTRPRGLPVVDAELHVRGEPARVAVPAMIISPLVDDLAKQAGGTGPCRG